MTLLLALLSPPARKAISIGLALECAIAASLQEAGGEIFRPERAPDHYTSLRFQDTRMGQGEIDLVAELDGITYFIEAKNTETTLNFNDVELTTSRVNRLTQPMAIHHSDQRTCILFVTTGKLHETVNRLGLAEPGNGEVPCLVVEGHDLPQLAQAISKGLAGHMAPSFATN